MKEINYLDYIKEATKGIEQGAFLTTKAGAEINTMTIGWGNIAYIWGKPIFTVLVRESRHSYQLLEDSAEFTVSIPLNNDLKKEVAFCGSKSGRDYDKFAQSNLTAQPGNVIDVPVVGECELHYECRVVYKSEMEETNLAADYKDRHYSGADENDYHTIYYGEIVSAYLTE